MAVLDFKLVNGDLVIDSTGHLVPLREEDALNQIIINTLSLWKGNYFRDEIRGVNWIQILKKQYNRNGIIQELARALLQSGYVDSVIDITLSVDSETRKAGITYLVESQGVRIRNFAEV